MMHTAAWIGVIILGTGVAALAVAWLIGMLRDPIGRGILAGLTVVFLIMWGIAGGLYLIAEGS